MSRKRVEREPYRDVRVVEPEQHEVDRAVGRLRRRELVEVVDEEVDLQAEVGRLDHGRRREQQPGEPDPRRLRRPHRPRERHHAHQQDPGQHERQRHLGLRHAGRRPGDVLEAQVEVGRDQRREQGQLGGDQEQHAPRAVGERAAPAIDRRGLLGGRRLHAARDLRSCLLWLLPVPEPPALRRRPAGRSPATIQSFSSMKVKTPARASRQDRRPGRARGHLEDLVPVCVDRGAGGRLVALLEHPLPPFQVLAVLGAVLGRPTSDTPS